LASRPGTEIRLRSCKRRFPRGRIEVEKEVDLLRLRLEHELSGGAYYLRRVKQEIDESSQQLQPMLDNARQTLAQAEKDWEVASKRNPLPLIIFVLLLAFFLGWAISSGRGSIPVVTVPENIEPVRGTRPAPYVAPNPEAAAEQEKIQKAGELYSLGMALSGKGKFAEAVPNFQEAIKLDPMIYGAHMELGYALYRLKRYEASAEASKAATRLHSAFRPYYNLGLVYVATGNWTEALPAFQQAIYLLDPTSWENDYTQAYYYLGISW
jgi:tetratricopeptide (TPR) repeat protein